MSIMFTMRVLIHCSLFYFFLLFWALAFSETRSSNPASLYTAKAMVYVLHQKGLKNSPHYCGLVSLSRPTTLWERASPSVVEIPHHVRVYLAPLYFCKSASFSDDGDFTPLTGLVVTIALWRKIYTNMGIFLFYKVISLHHSTVVNFQDHLVV